MDEAEPLTPAECDLRDFAFMPLEVSRLRRSKQWLLAKRRPEIGFYALNLWAASWHEVPAASLEDDDDVLADAAMCTPARWQKVKTDVMRGWIVCRDGRLYHPVVAEKANEAWQRKRQQRDRTEKARASRLTKPVTTSVTETVTSPVTESVTEPVTDIVTASKGQGQGQGQREGEKKDSAATAADASASAEPEILPPVSGEMPMPEFLRRPDPDPKKTIFTEGLAWLSANTDKPPDKLRPLLGKLCRDHGDAMVCAALVDAQQKSPYDPIAWMEKFLGKSKPGKRDAFVAALLGEPA